MQFKKGHKPWNKGRKGRQKNHNTSGLVLFKKGHKINNGRKISEETKEKLRQAVSGDKNPMSKKENRDKVSKAKNGIPHYNQRGEKCYLWKGGISYEDYSREFNKKLKENVRQRDKYRCQQCFRHQDELYDKKGKKYSLNIHHIDYDKKNNNSNNLIALCRNCHSQTNFKREDWTNYFNPQF